MDQIEKSVQIFKCLGDITRLRIVEALSEKPKSVGVIAAELQMSPSAISHQLSTMKNYNLVKNTKKGREVYYELGDRHVREVLAQVLNHASHI
ncbi:MAG TPA: transcriptional regulator [Acholeplasmatales bacterium]|nr:transcriptional regulator [Acholeplasmatales bacterium]